MGSVQAVPRASGLSPETDDNESLRSILTQLAKKRSWDKIERIFTDNPTIALSPEPSTGRLALHLAVLNGVPATIIKTLLTINAQSASVLDAAGETALHYALSNNATLETVRLFIQLSPSCLTVGDSQGVLPLHKAIEYKAGTVIICELLRACPESANQRTKNGKLALHYACEHQTAIDVVSLLLECFPDATGEVHNGRFPMHYACENKGSLEVITALHKVNQTAVSCKGVDGKHPLHMAVEHRCTVAVVEFLVMAHTDALMHRDRKGLHPIHYALERVAPDAIISCILKRKPETAQLRGKGSPGNFPLSTAIDKHYCPEIIRLILQAYPQAAGEKNMLGFWPLQLCMKNKISDIPLLTELLLAHPPAAKLVDEHGRRAVHYAASRNMDVAFVKALLETDPEGARSPDKNNQVPLHLAVIRGDIPLISLLLLYHPNGVTEVDRYGMVPINYAVENDASLELISLLLKTNKTCAENVINGKRTVLHQAVEFRRSTEVIQAIVAAFPGASRVQESVLGRLPLHWAIERLLPLPTLLCIDEANPVDGAYQCDHRGWRSIHYAIHYPTPTPIVYRLLRANIPLTLCKEDSLHLQYYAGLMATNVVTLPVVPAEQDVYLLLHYAVHNQALPETVAEILLYSMPYTVHGVFYANHCDTWTYIMAHCGDTYWRSVDIVLTHYEHDQALINKLAEFRDQTTQRCIDIATPRSLHEILRRMYYFSRYEMHKQLSIHVSQYSLSHSAIYHNTTFGATIANNPTNHDSLCDTSGSSANTTSSTAVVLKFTNHRSKFIREISVRTLRTVPVLNPDYVIPLLGYHNAQEDLKYAAEIGLKNFAKYPFLLVCKQGDRDLNAILKHEHVVSTDLGLIRTYMKQLLCALQYLHDVAGVVHGDIKPSNIIREGGVLKVTNLSAASKHKDKELVSAELLQLAYACPELALLQRQHNMLALSGAGESQSPGKNSTTAVHFSNQDAQLMNKTYSNAVNEGEDKILINDLFPVPNKPGERILSAPNQDMWSIGCIFYLLLTGESLFLNNVSEDIDSDQIDILTEWPDFVKQKRLEKVQDVSARCLLAQLLSRNPLQRPSAEYCLQHPFCTESAPLVRYIGVPATFEVYICHRRDKIVPIPAAQEPVEDAPPLDSGLVVGKEGEGESESSKKNTNLSAMQRMFGDISLSGSEGLEDSQSLDEGSVGEDNQAKSTADSAVQPTAGPVLMHMPALIDDITTPEGRVEMMRQYFNELGTTAADALQCAITVPAAASAAAGASAGGGSGAGAGTGTAANTAPTTGQSQLSLSNNDTEIADGALTVAQRVARGAAIWGREVALSKCGAAVIILSKDTWRALEDRCAELAKVNVVAQAARRATTMSVKVNKASGPTARTGPKSESELALEAEQLQLLDDFLYEVRLILELQSLGLLENGVFVVAAGEPQPVPTGNQATELEGRVLGEYFQKYMGDMVGRYGGSHPSAAAPNFVVPELESRLCTCLSTFGYGVAPSHMDLTLSEIFRFLVRLPTFHVIGPERDAFQAAVESISALIFRTSRMVRSVQSRPNTGAFSMYNAARIGSPLLVPSNGADSSQGRKLSASGSKKNSFSLHMNSSFSAHSMEGIMSGLTSGLTTSINPVGSSVTWEGSHNRALLRTSSGRKNRAVTPLAPLSHSRPTSSDVSLLHNPLHPGSDHNDGNQAQRVPRSPISGLRVRAFTPSKSPRHMGYTDTTTQLAPSRGVSAGRRALASPHTSAVRAYSSAHDLHGHNNNSNSYGYGNGNGHSGSSIPIRPWSGADGVNLLSGSFRNTTNFGGDSEAEGEDFTHENEVAFYNNEDIVTMPYFTEIIGEDRVRTANAITYMSTKLEASENQIANLEDELALLRAQLAGKDVELSHLRTVVASNSVQSPVIPKKRMK